MARIVGKDIPVMIGVETGFVQYDKDTGINLQSLCEMEEKAQE